MAIFADAKRHQIECRPKRRAFLSNSLLKNSFSQAKNQDSSIEGGVRHDFFNRLLTQKKVRNIES